MAIVKPFSSQGTTIEIFDNSTAAQIAAMTLLENSLKLSGSLAGRLAAYDTYFATFTDVTSASLTGTFINTTAAGGVSGTWSSASTGSSGTFISTGVETN
jgi:hypothetical protein